MSKTQSVTEPCPFEADFFAELAKSLAEPLPHELDDPAMRESNSWQHGARHGDFGIVFRAGRHNAGRKARARK